MQAATSRFDYTTRPPRQGLLRAYALALLVHALLLAALTWGVSWRRSDTSLSVEAELWSAVPQQAAPALVEPEPEPEPAPEPAPPPPPPPPKVEEPRQSEADIALAREKERQAKEKLEQARLEREKLAREKLEREKEEREKKLAEERKKREIETKRKEEADAKQRRDEAIKRMAGLAGATGAPNATGTAKQTAGVSSSYAGRIRARVKPNIVFSEELTSNPTAEVEVRTSPDGTIVGRKLLKSSGQKRWDDAVLKAIDKTEVLPRDVDGLVPSPLVIEFRLRD